MVMETACSQPNISINLIEQVQQNHSPIAAVLSALGIDTACPNTLNVGNISSILRTLMVKE